MPSLRTLLTPLVSVLLARLNFEPGKNVLPTRISVGAMRCRLPEDEEENTSEFLEVEFFDDESLVAICWSRRVDSEHHLYWLTVFHHN